MSETLHIETADVYEPPVLAEAGDFAELTQGRGIRFPEGSGARFGLSH
ncbi:lasso RiPP family leader peptide-containing protein [Streptomyces varsoviensis]|nr:lasso RiPP family leader peptide-containing protein [Streptomyces varsoviensis]